MRASASGDHLHSEVSAGRFPVSPYGKHAGVRDLAYLTRLHREPPPLLLECEQQGTYDRIPIVDRAVGQMLSVLVHCMQANRILEIGTAYGYSTLWMALALPPAGHIWTIDPDAERTAGRRRLPRARRETRCGRDHQSAGARSLAEFYQRNLDIVFLDAVKTEYEAYLELCVPMLKRSGLDRGRQPALARHGRGRALARTTRPT